MFTRWSLSFDISHDFFKIRSNFQYLILSFPIILPFQFAMAIEEIKEKHFKNSCMRGIVRKAFEYAVVDGKVFCRSRVWQSSEICRLWILIIKCLKECAISWWSVECQNKRFWRLSPNTKFDILWSKPIYQGCARVLSVRNLAIEPPPWGENLAIDPPESEKNAIISSAYKIFRRLRRRKKPYIPIYTPIFRFYCNFKP